MPRTSHCCMLALCLLTCTWSSGQPIAHVDRLKDLCLETELVAGGEPAAIIVCPAGQEYEPLVRATQQVIVQTTGVATPAKHADQVTEEDRRSRHLILLGNCNDNAVVGRLYGMRLVYCDGVYPGVGRPNPGFDLDEDGNGVPDGWSFSTPTGQTHSLEMTEQVARSAPRSVHLTGTEHRDSARGCVLRNLPRLSPGASYVMEVFYRARLGEGGYGVLHVDFYDDANTQITSASSRLPDAEDWTGARQEFTVPEETVLSRCLLYLYGQGELWYDDAALTPAGSTENLLSRGEVGSLVRTVHNPAEAGFRLGHGRNCLLLGGSDLAGVEQAVRRFAELVQEAGQDGILPRLMEISIGDTARGVVPGRAPDREAQERALEAVARDVATNAYVPVRGAFQRTRTYARNYHLTGDEGWARLYMGTWRVLLDSDSSNAHGPMEWIFQAVEGWDLIEECPVFTDGERLQITNRLLEIGVKNEERYAGAMKSTDRVIVGGHQLDQALCLYMHGFYFDKYYGINSHWMTMAEPIISIGELAPRVHDAYGYGPIIGNDFLSEYALATGDFDYFENGNCRASAWWTMLCTDSMGNGSTFGDGGAWRSGVPTALLHKARWYYRDQCLKWLMRDSRPPLGLFGDTEPAREPEELLGVAYIPLHERLYRVASTTAEDAGNREWDASLCPLERAFDKLSFRAGWRPDDEYMLIDGVSVISHGHQDGGSILRLTDNERLFLTEGHYIEVTSRRHNTVLVNRDGQEWAPPRLFSLEQKANLGRTGLVQIRGGKYNGVDWLRNVLWLRDGFFAVIDELRAKQPGEYTLECLWRSLGDVTLTEGGRFTVDQQGQGFTIERADDSRCLVRELLDYLGSNYYGSYPHCRDGLVKVLRQVKQATLAEGDVVRYLNLLHTHPADQPRLSAARIRPGNLWITGEDGFEALVGAGPCNLTTAFDTDAALYLVTSDGIMSMAGGSRLHAGPVTLTLSRPGSVECDLRSGSGVADCARQTKLKIATAEGDQEIALAPQRTEFSLRTAASAGARADLNVGVIAGVLFAPVPPQPAPALEAPGRLEEVWAHELPAPPTLMTGLRGVSVASTIQPLPASTWVADYEIALEDLVRKQDGIVLWRDDQAPVITVDLGAPRKLSSIVVKTLWTNNSQRGLRYRLKHLRLDAGLSEQQLHTVREFEETADHDIPSPLEYRADGLDLEARLLRITAIPQPGAAIFLRGIEAWGPPPQDSKRDDRIQPWGSNVARCLAAADLNGDGRCEVLLGTRQGLVRALSDSGDRLWEVDAGASVGAMAAGQLLGDERPEVVFGTDGQDLICLGADGAEQWRHAFSRFWGRDGKVRWLGIGDLEGGGGNEVVASVENWHYFAFEANGRERWRHEVRHGGAQGSLADLDGDGTLEVLAADEYYSWETLSHEGKRLWSVGGSGPVCTATWAADVDGDGLAEAAFGGQDMMLYARGEGAEVRFDRNVGGFVNAIRSADLDGDGVPELIVAADALARNLLALIGDGSELWSLSLPAAPRALAVVGTPEEPIIAAGCDDGWLVAVDASGDLAAGVRLPRPVEALTPADLDGDGRAEVVCCWGNLVAAYSPPR